MPSRPSKTLDTFANPNPERDYLIHIEVPEFTCLCPLTGQPDAVLARVIECCRGFRVFPDLEYKCGALFVPDEQIRYDEKAVRKVLLKDDGQGRRVLEFLRAVLASAPQWTPTALDELIRGAAEAQGLELGKIAQPLRVAVTGSTISPQISDTLDLLGRERTLARIDRALAHLQTLQ